MDASVIVNLVTAGISTLIKLVPMWIGASAEERKQIEAKTRALVEALRSDFAAYDLKDAAATKAAKDAIDGTTEEITKP